MLEADIAAKSGSPWDIPENYRFTYDCYSQKMVDKLNEIVEKYNLKLLSRKIFLDSYENSVLFQSLGLNGLVYDSPDIQVEYEPGAFYVEGTFSLNMYVSMDMGSWKWEQGFVNYRYSLKDYFDPATGSMLESMGLCPMGLYPKRREKSAPGSERGNRLDLC